MLITELLIALGIALVLTALFAAVFDTTGPWSGFWAFFLIVLLVAWAAGLWVRPFGPPLWGVYWAPYLVFGLIAALLIAAATPPNDERRAREVRRERAPAGDPAREPMADRPETAEEAAATGTVIALGMFFWILLLVLLTAVVLGYL